MYKRQVQEAYKLENLKNVVSVFVPGSPVNRRLIEDKLVRDVYKRQLLKLPGVGRKSANLIMGDVFDKPAIVTDTHCIRLVNRMGLVEDLKDPKKVEMALWKLIPPEEGSDFCHRLVLDVYKRQGQGRFRGGRESRRQESHHGR